MIGKSTVVVRLVRRDLQSIAVDDVEIDKLVALLHPVFSTSCREETRRALFPCAELTLNISFLQGGDRSSSVALIFFSNSRTHSKAP